MPKTVGEVHADNIALQAKVSEMQRQLDAVNNKFESTLKTAKAVASVIGVLSVAFIGVELIRIPKLIEDSAKAEAKAAAERLTTPEVISRQERLKKLVDQADTALQDLSAQVEIAEKGMTGYSVQAGKSNPRTIDFVSEGQKLRALLIECEPNEFAYGVKLTTTATSGVGGLTVMCKRLEFQRTR